MSIFDIDACEAKIGYSFKDKMLLRKCFTHSSYANEHGHENNELLEFFGDSILEFVVTEYLCTNAKGDEGKLTKERADIVSKTPLLEAMEELDVYEFVMLGRGQEKSISLDDKLYSSIYEALVAGIYLDGGMTAVKKFIKRTLISIYEQKKIVLENNKGVGLSKTAFQEYVQKNKLGSISYQTLSKSGPDHLPHFRVAALLNGRILSEGEGKSKKEAEAQAAAIALQIVKKS